MPTGRNLGEVIDRVITLLHPKVDEVVIRELTRIKNESAFRAPEDIYLSWAEATHWLSREVRATSHTKYDVILAIWNNTETPPIPRDVWQNMTREECLAKLETAGHHREDLRGRRTKTLRSLVHFVFRVELPDEYRERIAATNPTEQLK